MIMRNARLSWMLVGILSAVNICVPTRLFAHAEGHGDPEDYLAELKKDPIETVTGRVLSLSCYLQHGASSLNYERCSRSPLAKKYFSAALLTPEGDLYLLVMDHENAFRAVKKLLSKKAAARGRIVERDGIEVLILRSIKKIATEKK